MQFVHVVCVGKSDKVFGIKGLRYRKVDAQKLLADYKRDADVKGVPTEPCGFVQVWNLDVTGRSQVHEPGGVDGQTISSMLELYWEWDRRVLK